MASQTSTNRSEVRPQKLQRSHSIASQQWEDLKPMIQHLYMVESRTLRQVMEIMVQNYGFFASRAQYTKQLRKWSFFKRHPTKGDLTATQNPSDTATRVSFTEDLQTSNNTNSGLAQDDWVEIVVTSEDGDIFEGLSAPDESTQIGCTFSRLGSSRDSGYSSMSSVRHTSTRRSGCSELDPPNDLSFHSELGYSDRVDVLEDFGRSDDPIADITCSGGAFAPAVTFYQKFPMVDADLHDSGIYLCSPLNETKSEDAPDDTYVPEALTRDDWLAASTEVSINAGSWVMATSNDQTIRFDPLRPSRVDFSSHSMNVGGMSPSYIVDHRCPTNPSQASKASPTASKTSWSGSQMPAGTDAEKLMSLHISTPSDQSSLIEDMDLSNNGYQNALDCFLNWVKDHRLSQLVLRFHERSKLPLTESLVRTHTTDDSSLGTSITDSQSTTNASQSTTNSSEKRKLTDLDGHDRQEVPNDTRGTESQIKKQKKRTSRLACHFFRRNPSKFVQGRFKTCPYGFDGINRLKDHHNYVHRPAFYCRRCKRIFKSQDLKDAHEDPEPPARLCDRREDPDFEDYITTDARRAALAKRPRGVNDEKFWFEMWDKFFPGEERPDSAYQELHPEAMAFRSFAEREGPSIIRDYLMNHPEHALTGFDLHRFWQFAIDAAFARYISQGRSSSPSSFATAAMTAPNLPPAQQQQQSSTISPQPATDPVENLSLDWPNEDLTNVDFDTFFQGSSRM